MAPIVVLGRGPLPSRAHRRHSAAGLRSWQFARAAAASGERVELLLVDDEPTPHSGEQAAIRVTPIERPIAEDPSRFRAVLDALGPRAQVGATSYSSFLLAYANHPAPLWADLHGDPAAEAQALAIATADDRRLADYLWMLHWCLCRGDRFSVVSRPQRLVLIGQLGAAGRLDRSGAEPDFVNVVPDAVFEIPDRPAPPPEDAFQIVFTGSFNTWIDGDTFARAIPIVLGADPSTRFAITGGAIDGFLEEPWRRFTEALELLPSELRRRVRIAGWVDDEELESIESGSACGVVPEARLLEREIGSQNRSLRWMARGLPVVTTAQCELGEAIERERLGLAYRPGDATDLARALLELAGDRQRARELGLRAREWVARHRTAPATTEALTAWLRAPAPEADRGARQRAGSPVREPLALHPALDWISRVPGTGELD